MILDDATSALDSVIEAEVQRALDRLLHGRTTFIIARRLSNVRGADLVLVVEQGRIVECGPPGELLAQGGAFARLFDTQQLGTQAAVA